MKKIECRYVACLLVAGSMALWLSACATTRPTGAHQTQVERKAVVTVTAMDVPNRLVTVRNAAGESFTVYVDPSVTTFPQAKVGDQVQIRYTESFAVQLKKPGEKVTGLEVREETSRPQPGKPGGQTATEVKATVRIEAVDQKGSIVTFTGPRGRRTVQILDPSLREYTKQLRAGDTVEATYREALALSLERVSGG